METKPDYDYGKVSEYFVGTNDVRKY